MVKKSRKRSDNIHTVSGSLGAELLGLEPPFSSAPAILNKHFLYINKGENLLGVGFAATYAAKKFIDILLGDDELAKTRGITGEEDTIVSSSGISIRSEEIDEILNYEFSKTEEEWTLPDAGSGSSSCAMSFRSSSGIRVEKTQDNEKTERAPRHKIEKIVKPSKEGLITIQQIAGELKMEARDCRAILRKMKVDKPQVGWAWNKIEVDDIRKIINDNKE